MRTWTGCLTCRARKVKCDERKPLCRNCEKSQVECVPSELVSFRHWRHPSPNKNGYFGLWERSQTWVEVRISALEVASYEFVDETNAIADEYEIICDEAVARSPVNHSKACRTVVRDTTDSDAHIAICEPHQARITTVPSSPTHWNDTRGYVIERSTPAEADHASWHNGTSVIQSRGEFDRMKHGEAVRGTASSRSSNSSDDTGGTVNKGAQALLSMSHASDLRLAYTSTSISPPESLQTYCSQDSPFTSVVHPSNPGGLAQVAPLSSQEEAWLLRQFSAEVGTWMDLSDLSETFSKKVCRLATHDPLLKAASIACAAKQQYLIGKLPDGMHIARRNYNTAISLLIDRLGNNNEPLASYGFAATVICSCYEMLDAPASDWQRHLDGVFSFSKLRRVNGSSGGIEQAGFWSTARQDVVCSIMHRSKLRLDPDLWAIDLEHIGQEGSEDLVNNQILTILAKVVNFIACSDAASASKGLDEWYKLRNLLDHWNLSVKDQSFMDPVSVYEEDGKPFTTIWFVRSVCASSWQMFHLAQILLLTSCPTQDRSCMLAFRRVEDQLLYHARQICGIAQSKPDGSCRVNSVQPIYYAGCCFGDNEERKAAIMLLEEIEDNLGWAAKYRAWDLRKLCTEI